MLVDNWYLMYDIHLPESVLFYARTRDPQGKVLANNLVMKMSKDGTELYIDSRR